MQKFWLCLSSVTLIEIKVIKSHIKRLSLVTKVIILSSKEEEEKIMAKRYWTINQH